MSALEHSRSDQLLALVQHLLTIETTDEREALRQAALLISQALNAEKADVFFYEPDRHTLVAQGVSDTALGRLQQSLGLDQLSLANGGHTVSVFQTGIPFRSGDIEHDPEELPGLKNSLRIRSTIIVPLPVGKERRGIIQVDSLHPDVFTDADLHLLEGVAQWVGLMVHRAQLLQQAARAAAAEARRGTAEALITVLAHDFRNYLTPIQGRLGLLHRRATREQRQQDLDDLRAILSSVRRFEALILDLMDTERLSKGLFVLDIRPLDLARLLREITATLSTPAVTTKVDVPDHLIISGDENRLCQALENVVSNAIKHAPQRNAYPDQGRTSGGGQTRRDCHQR